MASCATRIASRALWCASSTMRRNSSRGCCGAAMERNPTRYRAPSARRNSGPARLASSHHGSGARPNPWQIRNCEAGHGVAVAAAGICRLGQRQGAPRLGAALAYYTSLSLAALLLVVIGIAGLAFGHEAARGEVLGQLRGLVGDDGARDPGHAGAHTESSFGSACYRDR